MKISHLNCDSKVVVRAKRITAVIHNGFLVGWDSERLLGMPKKPEPLAYDSIDFCQKCERVFNSIKKVEENE